MVLLPLDVDSLHRRFTSADPFPHVVLDDVIEPEFARRIAASLPSFEQSLQRGFRFETVNERRKVQVTDRAALSPPLRELLDALHSPEWLETLGRITGIPGLLADERLLGGGLHQTGRGGRLDVHTDFNYVPDVQWFRRLNLLLYLNPGWREEWGGELELWDDQVKNCRVRVSPVLGRCVVFATSTKSFHGTTTIRSPDDVPRSSFALYYYTREAPPDFNDQFQGTVFRARPNERLKGRVLMPLERRWNLAKWHVRQWWNRLRRRDPDKLRGT